MENLRNRCTVDLVTSEEKLKKLAAQPSFKQFKIFQENLVAVEQAKVELTLNRPIYVRFAILDLSIYSIFLGTRKKANSIMMNTKKIIGKMKDELSGEIIEEFSLKMKMYSLKTKKKK